MESESKRERLKLRRGALTAEDGIKAQTNEISIPTYSILYIGYANERSSASGGGCASGAIVRNLSLSIMDKSEDWRSRLRMGRRG